MIPILEAMEPEINNIEWIAETAHALAGVMAQLKTAAFAAEGVYNIHLIFSINLFRVLTGNFSEEGQMIHVQHVHIAKTDC